MIELHDLTLSFGEKRVLDGFSLKLPESGVICLSGPSGCGKTTIARILTFLQEPDSGCLTGIAPGDAAILFQEDRLLPWLSAKQNLMAVCPEETAMHWLDAVGLGPEADSLPGALSGGMRRRVALARALALDSKLLILDEPFNGVDEAAKSSLYPLILSAAKRNPVLLITHHEAEIDALDAEVIRLDGPPLHIL